MNENQQKLRDQLAHHEGRSLTAYLDTKGILTVGIGHNLIARPIPGLDLKPGDTITDDQCDRIFEADFADAEAQLDHYLPWASALDVVRWSVLVNLIFNMGIGSVLKFGHMLAALHAGKYDLAADELVDSKWAADVGPHRASELKAQLATGEWQEG